MIKKWDLNNKQYIWLRLLYRSVEVGIIKLRGIEHEVIHRVVNKKKYDLYEKILLNKLRDKYKKDYLMKELDNHISSKRKSATILGGSSAIHPSDPYYIIGNGNLSKPIITSTPNHHNSSSHFKDMWMHQHFDLKNKFHLSLMEMEYQSRLK